MFVVVEGQTEEAFALATASCGMVRLSKRCPRFSSWIRRLEALGSPPADPEVVD